ncbi:unnamed protein product [Didymodactylos carnosus]|uniref:Uncharacterized protein n=1 Tax=Didymodactylos carnosus TaxID=1234261 RepID=A0A8S2EAW8_9BILA|nr:unnamed protein product [Didymodactylos carnosus]CAF3986074.1 unnamed protein product [Didymodactylos carnosus]
MEVGDLRSFEEQCAGYRLMLFELGFHCVVRERRAVGFCYYTDNGAYYYYHTELNLNYQQTILALSKHIQELNLPVKYFQYDSWFYYRGIGNGVTQWTSRPDIFPDGIDKLHDAIHLPIGAHNRYWASNTTYAKDNGGKYSFLIDKLNEKSLPVGNDTFWTDLFYEATTKWGLILYEQDWMNHQTIDFSYLRTNAHLGRQWLMSMGKAADEQNLNIQYCMALSRHALQSVEIQRVTQARVSDDYFVHLVEHDPQWKIGTSSILAYALGVVPFKDVFWSTSEQPLNPYKRGSYEPNPDLQILISTLSTGPVASGDRIGYFDTQRIMKCCNKDGLILKPNRPLTMIDKLLQDWSWNDGTSNGELYSTVSTIGQNDASDKFYILFASNMKSNYDIYPTDLGLSASTDINDYVAYSWSNPFELVKFSSNNSLSITTKQCGTNDINSFCLWYISPLWQFSQPSKSIYALLGEFNKWVPVSKQRFQSLSISQSNNRTAIDVKGSSLEYTQFLIYSQALGGVITLPCQLSSHGYGQIVITTQSAVCLPTIT